MTREVLLGEAVGLEFGFPFKSGNFNTDGAGLPLVRIRDVVPGTSNTYYNGDFDPRYLVNDGDYLIGMDGEFNLGRWRGGEALLNQRVAKLGEPAKVIDRDYLARFLPAALKVIEEETPFVTVKHLSAKRLRAIKIPVPPLDEQRRIAAILDKVDAVLQRRKLSIEHLSRLNQAVFLDMFGHPGRSGLRWPVKPLSEITENQDSVRVPLKVADRSKRQGSYPYYGASGVIDSIDDFLFDGDRLLVSEDGANLLARSTPIAFIASGRFWVNNHAHVLASTGAVELKYLEAVFANLDIAGFLTGSTQPKLTRSALDRIEIPVPPKALQLEFATRTDAVAELLTSAGRQMDSLSDGFASIQSRAFAGQL